MSMTLQTTFLTQSCLTQSFPTPALPATTPNDRAPRPAFAGPIAAVRRGLAARRTRLALSALDDRTLADIGLRRCDIQSACARL